MAVFIHKETPPSITDMGPAAGGIRIGIAY